MPGHDRIDCTRAAAMLRDGAVIAYPTEAVWGLGCDPFDEGAVMRLLELKRRAVDKGLILIAAGLSQLDGLADWPGLPQDRCDAVRASWPGPHTWIVPATARVPRWITGAHAGVAMRVSAHPAVAALCTAFGGVLVSTSANRAGQPPPHGLGDIDAMIRDAVDGIAEGEAGALARPTPIRDALTDAELRA